MDECKHVWKRAGTWTDVLYRMFWILQCTKCGAAKYSNERF